MFNSDIPAPPTNFEFQVRKDDNRTITLTWTESVQTEPANKVEDYVVEQSINGGDFQLVWLTTKLCHAYSLEKLHNNIITVSLKFTLIIISSLCLKKVEAGEYMY